MQGAKKPLNIFRVFKGNAGQRLILFSMNSCRGHIMMEMEKVFGYKKLQSYTPLFLSVPHYIIHPTTMVEIVALKWTE